MLTLAIETSNPSSSPAGWTAVAVGEGATVLSRAPLEPRDRHDDALMPAIDRACREAGVAPADLARVAVSVGPGGFTALRIAVTTAKMLALTHGVRCIGVPTAGALARRCPLDLFRAGPLAVALAWKRDSVWIERFASPSQPTRSGLDSLDTLDLTGCSALICDDRVTAALASANRLPASVAALAPVFDAVAVLEAAADLQPTDPMHLAPLYPREPEAVTKWRDLHA